ncbi:MAG: histidine kinase, partial [Actinomycetota bacterium]
MGSISWRRPPLVDVALALATLVVGLISLRSYLGLFDGEVEVASGPVSVALLCLTVLPLAYRRVAPLTVALLVGASFTAVRWLEVAEFDMSTLALFVALYGAGAFGGARRTLVRVVVILPSIGLIAWRIVEVDGEVPDGALLWIRVSTITLNAGFFAAAWILGDGARRRREAEEELRERTVELERERELNEQRAVLDERVRIARELHDVVAHHVSVMGLQAGAARRALEHDPESSRAALRSVEDSGREAVRELHQLLGFLRQDERPRSDPQPGLARLPTLVEQVEEAGLDTEVRVDGTLDDVPDSVSLSAYRIVQEALTNTLRHADASSVRIAVDRVGDGLAVTVEDDGAADAGPVARSGRGEGRPRLRGLAERAQLHHRTLEAGPPPRG